LGIINKKLKLSINNLIKLLFKNMHYISNNPPVPSSKTGNFTFSRWCRIFF